MYTFPKAAVGIANYSLSILERKKYLTRVFYLLVYAVSFSTQAFKLVMRP